MTDPHDDDVLYAVSIHLGSRYEAAPGPALGFWVSGPASKGGQDILKGVEKHLKGLCPVELVVTCTRVDGNIEEVLTPEKLQEFRKQVILFLEKEADKPKTRSAKRIDWRMRNTQVFTGANLQTSGLAKRSKKGK